MSEQIQVTLPDGSKKDLPRATTALEVAKSISPRLADAPTESGFFYDFYRPTPFTPEDLEKIEKRMLEVVNRDEQFQREFIPREEGLARFRTEGDFMKVHFVEQFTKPGEPISVYRNGK